MDTLYQKEAGTAVRISVWQDGQGSLVILESKRSHLGILDSVSLLAP